jgi:hypothetical protein
MNATGYAIIYFLCGMSSFLRLVLYYTNPNPNPRYRTQRKTRAVRLTRAVQQLMTKTLKTCVLAQWQDIYVDALYCKHGRLIRLEM